MVYAIPTGKTHLITRLVRKLGFKERIRGGVPEIINIQQKGSKARVCQVRQIRGIILKHKLGGQNVDTL